VALPAHTDRRKIWGHGGIVLEGWGFEGAALWMRERAVCYLSSCAACMGATLLNPCIDTKKEVRTRRVSRAFSSGSKADTRPCSDSRCGGEDQDQRWVRVWCWQRVVNHCATHSTTHLKSAPAERTQTRAQTAPAASPPALHPGAAHLAVSSAARAAARAGARSCVFLFVGGCGCGRVWVWAGVEVAVSKTKPQLT